MEKEECDKNQGSEIVPIQEVNPLRMILSEKITSLATLMSTSMMYQWLLAARLLPTNKPNNALTNEWTSVCVRRPLQAHAC